MENLRIPMFLIYYRIFFTIIVKLPEGKKKNNTISYHACNEALKRN